MDYAAILEELNRASLFDLHRLDVAIQHQLEDPRRLEAVKRQLRPGQEISYFDTQLNGLVDATIVEVRRTRATVINRADGRRWAIPLYFINIDQVPTDIQPMPSGERVRNIVDRTTLKVGDPVSFVHSNGVEHFGKVFKLNPKTAGVKVGELRWRVAYSLLSPVIEGELIEGEALVGELLGIEKS